MDQQYCYALKIHASMVDQMTESLSLIEGLSGLISTDISPELVKKKKTDNFLLTAVFVSYAESEVTRMVKPFYPDAVVQEHTEGAAFDYQDFTNILGPGAE
jgi:hypothetical protein